ncbi:hypothetical protein UFOVP215_18 [uncultured Caudovirales phage]|uniref:Uncharacterized protein n=1 Tax=uncultured Caudovirales phage TaxID=2100421 RepID=A0A6J7WL55_9CAUD|nr:hypothetical protein UFOVP215_18 [uncultured Caudovirales phage]
MKYYFVFFVFFLSSCFTEQKANKQLNKIEKSYPSVLADRYSELFPPKVIIDSLKITDFILRIDTFLSINTDTLLVNNEVFKTDSAIVNKYNKLVIKLNSANSFIEQLKTDLRKNPPYIIKTIIDSSKVFALTIERNQALKDKEKYHNRYDVFMTICIWLLIFLIILISYIYINETKSKLY